MGSHCSFGHLKHKLWFHLIIFFFLISRFGFLTCFGRGWKGFDLGIGILISSPWGHALGVVYI
jgi:hypothetical protein